MSSTVLSTLLGERLGGFLQRTLDVLQPAHDGGARHEDVRDPAQFTSWLNYHAFDAEREVFVLSEGIGFALEARPQSGADQAMVDMLRGLYTIAWPAGASLQISIFGTPHIKPALLRYATQRKVDADQAQLAAEYGRPARNRSLYRLLARRRVDHYLRGAVKSIAPGANYLLRDYRLVITGFIPAKVGDVTARERLVQLRANVASTLQTAGFPPRIWGAADLINWCANFCNPHRLFEEAAPLHYDAFRQVRDQIVDIDTRQLASESGLRFRKPNRDDPVDARFFAVKGYPERFALWRMGGLLGDSLQNSLQYPCPFLLTMGVQFQEASAVKAKVSANQMRATQNAASKSAPYTANVEEKRRDWTEALGEVQQSGTLLRLYHTLGIWAHPDDMERAEAIAEGLWRDQGFSINNISFLHRIAFLSALPLAYGPGMQEALYSLGISSTKSIPNAVHLSPMIGEWRGSQNPVLLFAGRRGQVCGLDLYDNTEGNYSAAIVGTPGSGKSVFLNEMASSYLGAGAKVWMLDLGKSFERLCDLSDGQMVDLHSGCGVNINPFSFVVDFNDDLDMLQATVAKMAAPYGALDPFQYAAISTALTRCWKAKGNQMTVSDLREVFLPGRLNPDEPHDQRLTDLAVMLEPYCTGGAYAEFFDGPSNVDFARQLVVIEVESLKRSAALHRVVLMILLFRITSEMYFTRNNRKLLIIDELKQQLGSEDDSVVTRIIEEAARRARKYGGALVTATHQVEDYHASPALLTAFTLSDAVFILRQRKESVELLARSGKLAIDEQKKRLLQTLRLEKGAYAEMYAFTQMGEGILRLVLDPATLLTFSNRHEDNGPLDEYRAQGLSVADAVAAVLRDRGIEA